VNRANDLSVRAHRIAVFILSKSGCFATLIFTSFSPALKQFHVGHFKKGKFSMIETNVSEPDWAPFTPLLNAALDVIWKDRKRGSSARAWAWVVRNTWGNWKPFIEYPFPDRFPKFRSNPPLLAEVIGSGPCPFCGGFAAPKAGMPKDWRWHLRCMQVAYACDSMRFGSPEAHVWARSIMDDIAHSGEAASLSYDERLLLETKDLGVLDARN
jgi:hypothetical protein